jgi:hypothetical protein
MSCQKAGYSLGNETITVDIISRNTSKIPNITIKRKILLEKVLTLFSTFNSAKIIISIISAQTS